MLHQSQVLHCKLHVAAHLLMEAAAAAGLYDEMSGVNWRRQPSNGGINPLIVLPVRRCDALCSKEMFQFTPGRQQCRRQQSKVTLVSKTWSSPRAAPPWQTIINVSADYSQRAISNFRAHSPSNRTLICDGCSQTLPPLNDLEGRPLNR